MKIIIKPLDTPIPVKAAPVTTVVVKPLATPIMPVALDFIPLRQQLIDQGIITTPEYLLGLDPTDSKRIAYEMKLILMGDVVEMEYRA